LEKQIVDTSLRFGVLCRFTAYVAVDSRVVAEGGMNHDVMQPVEAPAGWDLFAPAPMPTAAPLMAGSAYAAGAMSAPMQFAGGPAAPSAFAPSFRLGAKMAGTARTPNVPHEHPELGSARQQARDEARRLREAGPLADYERRELLADLASRLTALLHHLTAEGVPPPEFSALRALVDAIEAGGAVDPLWDTALRVLDDFAAGTGAPKKHRTFWKRG
jgi:Ca-activated chloride channel family protein